KQLRPPLRLANLLLAQAFADVCECTTGDAAQPACCVLGLALFIDPASLEFRKPSAEFGQLGRREPHDRLFDVFDCHGRRNSTPALELKEQWPASRDVITVFRQPVIEVGMATTTRRSTKTIAKSSPIKASAPEESIPERVTQRKPAEGRFSL